MIYVKVAFTGDRSGFVYWLVGSDGFSIPSRSRGYRTSRLAHAAGERARKRYLKNKDA